jgi:hypothetical protein
LAASTAPAAFGRKTDAFESPVGHQPSAVLAANGTILFPTLRGVAILDPARRPPRGTLVLFEGVRFRDESGRKRRDPLPPDPIAPAGHDVEVFYLMTVARRRTFCSTRTWNTRHGLAAVRTAPIAAARLLAGRTRPFAPQYRRCVEPRLERLVIGRAIWERWRGGRPIGCLCDLERPRAPRQLQKHEKGQPTWPVAGNAARARTWNRAKASFWPA